MGDNDRQSGASSKTRSSPMLRNRSTAERLDNILENARARAETLEGGSHPPGQQPAVPSRAQHDTDVGSADETTGMMSMSSGRNYQAVQSAASAPQTARLDLESSLDRTAVSAPPTQPSQQPTFRGRHRTRHDAFSAGGLGKVLNQFKSIELDNKGSVARDHLALERTFLAWLRTSLAFASIGIAVTQLFRLNTSLTTPEDEDENRTLRRMGKPLGTTFLGISIVILLLGFRRYFHAQEWVLKGKYPASRGTIIVVALVTLAIMLLSLVVVIVIHPKDEL